MTDQVTSEDLSDDNDDERPPSFGSALVFSLIFWAVIVVAFVIFWFACC